ncbi:MAG: nucleotidyltransferase family protein [Spirochaetota bacterium]
MDETRQLAGLGPELDFLALAQVAGEEGDLRGRVSRWMRSGDLVGVVKGIYVTAPELRKRPVSLEILANMIFGPSYVSFEYVLSRAGLIPEAVRTLTSATPKRNRDFDTPLGRFSYRHLPPSAYSFGWTHRELEDGSSWLEALPEKALLDWLYRAGSLRSVSALEERLFEDLRLDPELFRALDRQRLSDYAARMHGATFGIHFMKLLGRGRGLRPAPKTVYNSARKSRPPEAGADFPRTDEGACMPTSPSTDPFEYLRSRREELSTNYGITSLRVFGSRARGDAGSGSDLDILIEAEKPYRFDLLALIALEEEMSEDLGMPVDLVLDEDLKPHIGERARAEAISI